MSYEPTVMRRALARLERRREGRERRRYDLERELYAREPRLRELDAALRSSMADLARLATGGATEKRIRLRSRKHPLK